MLPSNYSSQSQTRQQLDELDSLLQRMLSLPLSGATETTTPITSGEPKKPAPTAMEPFAPLPPTLPSAKAAPTAPSNGQPIIQPWRTEAAPPTALVPRQPAGTDEAPMAIPIESQMQNQPLYTPSPVEPRFFAPPPQSNPPIYVPPQPSASTPYPYSVVFGQQAPQAAPAAPSPPVAENAATNLQTERIPVPQWMASKETAQPGLPVTLWPVYLLNLVFDLLTYLLGPVGTILRGRFGRNALGWLGILMIVAAVGWGVADWYGLDPLAFVP